MCVCVGGGGGGGGFLELDQEISQNLGMVIGTLMTLCVTAGVFGKTFFAPKLGKYANNRTKIGSFEFKEILKKIEFKLIFTEFVL